MQRCSEQLHYGRCQFDYINHHFQHQTKHQDIKYVCLFWVSVSLIKQG